MPITAITTKVESITSIRRLSTNFDLKRKTHISPLMLTTLNYQFCVRLMRASDTRISRFHDEKGQFALKSISDFADLLASAETYVLGRLGYRRRLPWITFKALRFLKKCVNPSSKVFEWGSGMSTLWWETRTAQVFSVENNERWFRRIKSLSNGNAEIRLRTDPVAYVDTIKEFPAEFFDVIVIDGIERLKCFNTALGRLRPGGLLVVDNTDMDRITKGDLHTIDALIRNDKRLSVHQFSGWVPCRLSPQETSICVYEADRNSQTI